MDLKLQLIIHGRGNAWPVFLGQTHPFYNRHETRALSNASYSLVATREDGTSWEVLVDAGHGTVQSMLSGRNRIPDCICLTHGHLDHTLGVDWVVQSFSRTGDDEALYPVYASGPVLGGLVETYPQLGEKTGKYELVPSSTVHMADGIEVTAFPVYHGKGALGASMLLFTAGGKKILFTGDLFCPLLREKDYEVLGEPDLLVVDTNNRFPWPRTNHWSFAGSPGDPGNRNEVLKHFLDHLEWETLAAPHLLAGDGHQAAAIEGQKMSGDEVHPSAGYFEDLRREWNITRTPFTIVEFIRKIRPQFVLPVHYSGTEDEKHYGESRLGEQGLGEWIERIAAEAGLRSRFMIPSAGQVIDIIY